MNLQLTTSAGRHVVAILLLAALVRVHAAARLECVSRDGVHFVEFARQLAADPAEAMRGTSKQPGYSYLLLGAIRMLGGDSTTNDPRLWLLAGQIVSVTGGVAVCLLIYFLTRRMFGPILAGIAGLFAALWPQGAELSGDALSDMPHLALYLAALLAAWRAIERADCVRRQLGWSVACGLLAGAAYWLRQEALGAMLAACICLLHRPGRGRRGRAAIAALAMFVAFSVVVSPPSIFTGHVMPNKDVWELLFGAPEARAAVTAPPEAASSGVPPATAILPLLLVDSMSWYKALGRMADAWGASSMYVLSTLVVVGFFLRSAPRADRTGAALVGVAIVLQLVAVLLRVKSYGEISARYMVIPAALTIPWAASGFTTIVSLIAAGKRPRRAAIAVAAGMVLALAPLAWFSTRPISPDKACYRQAGEWLAARAGGGAIIMAHDRLEQLLFYAGRFEGDDGWMVTASAGAPGAPLKPPALLAELHGGLSKRRPAWYVDATRSRRWSDADDAAFFLELRGGAMPLREVQRFTTDRHDVFIFQVEQPD